MNKNKPKMTPLEIRDTYETKNGKEFKDRNEAEKYQLYLDIHSKLSFNLDYADTKKLASEIEEVFPYLRMLKEKL